MIESPKFLGISKISRRYSITITKEVREYLPLDDAIGKEIAFCQLNNSNTIVLVFGRMKGDEIFMAANKLSNQFSIVVPEAVRETLKIHIGDHVKFNLEKDKRISMEKLNINKS